MKPGLKLFEIGLSDTIHNNNNGAEMSV